jgi:hypothetical protein
MKVLLASVVLLMSVLTPAMAQRSTVTVITPRGAPAPLLGAGLPGLGIALGYGAYWLARRRNKAA